MSLFQSNLRKQIRNLPKILNFVKIIHYFSKLFTSLLNEIGSSSRWCAASAPSSMPHSAPVAELEASVRATAAAYLAGLGRGMYVKIKNKIKSNLKLDHDKIRLKSRNFE